MFDIKEIQRVLPQKYPFLLIDRIIELDPEKSAVGYKNVTINEPFFEGHFPDDPVMPGVLILEAMAQLAAFLIIHSGVDKGKFFFKTVNTVKFRHPVLPGDQLKLEVKVIEKSGETWKFDALSRVGETLSTEAKFTAEFRQRDTQ
ncbi:MAG TPA: 3-hydroxyacyl-ACP dehydratase FabZ [Thermodesulfovibrionia bacterium]|nr:3-hydroxyacyl-ACP dehydratase FabZ [Thermodesulfovibrionia bacterium]